MNIERKYGKTLIVCMNVAAIFFMVYIIASGASYTVLLGDDYTHGVRVGAFHVPFFQYFAASLRYAREIYLDWQGTYFAMFMQAFLSPINNFGLPQLKLVMVANALLFFLSLFGVVWTAFDYVWKDEEDGKNETDRKDGRDEKNGKKPHIRLTAFTIILFSVLDAAVFTEIFFWYSGAVAYSIPFSCMLLSILCFLIYNNKRYSKKNLFAVLSGILLFLAAGGSLAVSGTGCYAVLLLTFGFYLADKKVSIRNIAVTAAGIIGSLINVAAPGNFSRHTYSSGGEHSWRLLQSVKWTVKNVWSETERLTRETMFGVMILAMVLFGIYLSKSLGDRWKRYGVLSVLALGWGYVTAFPVAFGYSGPEFPNRCCFILDVTLVLSLLNLAVFCGCCLDRWGKLRENKSACAVLAVVLLAAFLFSPESLSESALLAVAESGHNGSYKRYYQECKAVYDYLETCPEEDVVLAMPEYIENFECLYFDSDENGWVNVGIAKYYGKKSVRRAQE